MARRVVLEVCVASVDDALAAVRGGADRLELNAGLALGGLTPSAGLFAEVMARVSVPVIAMVRPRPGGFYYSPSDLAAMRRDAEAFVAGGAAGLAFGVLTENGEIDVARCRVLRDVCGEREAVFHRAFDVTPDPFGALDRLIELGIRRVMTSGQEPSAAKGADLIAELVGRAAGRIEILPAGGVNAQTVRDVVRRTGCDQVHASLRTGMRDPSAAARPKVRFGTVDAGSEEMIDRTDDRRVAELRALLSDSI
jgi:copper homeostasis protein